MASGSPTDEASKRVEVRVGHAPRAEAEHGAGMAGISDGFGSNRPRQPVGGMEPGLPSGHAVTPVRDTPVRLVALKGTGPYASPEPRASGQDHVGGALPGIRGHQSFARLPQ